MESKWIIWTFIPMLNWAAWIHAGVRAKYPKYFLIGGLYGIPFVLAMACSENEKGPHGEYSTAYNIAMTLNMISWIGGIIHSQMVKREVNLRIKYAGQSAGGTAADDQLERKIASEYGARVTPSPTSPSPAVQRPIAPSQAVERWLDGLTEESPSTVERPVVSPQPVPRRPAPPLAVPPQTVVASPASASVDVNSASEQQIAALPGVGPILAKKAIKFRQSERAFQSVGDFAQVLGLKPHILQQLRARVVANAPAQTPRAVEKRSGRVVDF